MDLDECLIYGSEVELRRAADFRVGQFHVYRRPGLSDFLNAVSRCFKLAVWSSGSTDYVNAIASEIRLPDSDWAFVWARDRCTPRQDFDCQELTYFKDLKKVKRLGYELDRILFVDDTPGKMSRNYGNAVYVNAFEGDDNDVELVLLAKYLVSIAGVPDFRRLEKRNWRSHVAGHL